MHFSLFILIFFFFFDATQHSQIIIRGQIYWPKRLKLRFYHYISAERCAHMNLAEKEKSLRERNCINKSKRQHRNKSGTEKGKKNKKKKWLWPSGNWPSWYQRRIAGRWLHFKELNYCFHINSSYAIDCVLLHELRSISQFSINLFHMKIMIFFRFSLNWISRRTFESRHVYACRLKMKWDQPLGSCDCDVRT